MNEQIVYVPVSVELLQALLENSWDLRSEWQWKVSSVKSSYNREMERLSKDISETEAMLANPSSLLKEKDEQIDHLKEVLEQMQSRYDELFNNTKIPF